MREVGRTEIDDDEETVQVRPNECSHQPSAITASAASCSAKSTTIPPRNIKQANAEFNCNPHPLPVDTDNNLYTATNRNRNYQRKRRLPKILNKYCRARKGDQLSIRGRQRHEGARRDLPTEGKPRPTRQGRANATHQPAIHLPLVPFEGKVADPDHRSSARGGGAIFIAELRVERVL